jgi:hypothetical protein
MPTHGLRRCDGHHKLVDCIEPPRESAFPTPGALADAIFCGGAATTADWMAAARPTRDGKPSIFC